MEKMIPLEPNCLRGRSVQIATPCGSGSYDDVFTLSLTNTLDLLTKLGATVDFARLAGCSDLPFARARLFGGFLRGPHTDMMMIDSDMGWEPIDIVRLLLTNRDFIGAAGPKKKKEKEYAFNNCTDKGGILPITVEADSGIMTISEVGMAFVLISKYCAKRMAEAYADLAFVAEDGKNEFDVFNPLIIPGTNRRLPEDFAFCYRWRQIGGKVHILPNITLQHSGRAIWQGSVSEREHETIPAVRTNGHTPPDNYQESVVMQEVLN